MRRDVDLAIVHGYSMCLWEFTYWHPDRRLVLAPPMMLQKYDLVPGYPELRKFLDFWTKNIEGKLHSVRVSSERLIRPAEFRLVGMEMRLH